MWAESPSFQYCAGPHPSGTGGSEGVADKMGDVREEKRGGEHRVGERNFRSSVKEQVCLCRMEGRRGGRVSGSESA